jgi:outer membrane protein assembly factor BamB
LLVCADRATGKILWTDAVKGKANEDRPGTQFMQHGYASSTPATDGERVYVLFGKSGVLAYDLAGKRLWQVDVGEGSAPSGWGSAASPILYKNLVLVNAAAEGPALVALDKETGKEVWKAEAEGLSGCWSTPVLVDIGEGKQDLVLNVPGEIWGFNPETGKLRWYCDGIPGRTVNPSVVAKDGIVYAIGSGPGGRGGAAAIAVRAGGRGDVNATHVVWRQSVGSYVPSPVIAGEHLYWINNQSIAHCLKLADGEPVLGASGRRLSGVGDIYASLLAADGKLYAFSRFNGAFVYSATPEFEELAHNELGAGAGRCNASPAVSKGQLLVRSDKYLYCLGAK